MGPKGTLYNDKKIKPPGRHNNPQSVCTKYQSLKTYKLKTELKGEIPKITISSWRLQHFTPKMKTEPCYELTFHRRYVLTKQHMKRYSNFLNMREGQIKTTMRDYLIFTWLKTPFKCWRSMELFIQGKWSVSGYK